MLLSLGAPVGLQLRTADAAPPIGVCANREKTLVAVVSKSGLFVFQTQSRLLLCAVSRDENDVRSRGANAHALWRSDSTAICVTTTGHCLLIYTVSHVNGTGAEGTPGQPVTTDAPQCYEYLDPSDGSLRRRSEQLFPKDKRPHLSLSLSMLVKLSAVAACAVSMGDELFIWLADGWLHRMTWAGQPLQQYAVHVGTIPFTYDQQQSKPEHLPPGVHVLHAAYSPLIGGFSLVLSNGRAALLLSQSATFAPDELLAVWAAGVDQVKCTAVNHRYRLVAYGLSSGHLAAHQIDETTGALTLVYRVTLHCPDEPQLMQSATLGRVTCLQWYPYGQAIAVAWKGGPLALFSVFGAQLWYSGGDISSPKRSLDWGPEGHVLWTAGAIDGLKVHQFVRTATLNNPSSSRMAGVCLLSADTVYLSPVRALEQHASAPHAVWKRIKPPFHYMATSWPLRFCAADTFGSTVCVAGGRGLARYTARSGTVGKWSLFGNESHEQRMVVTGGLALWDDFAVCACYDMDLEGEQLRFYPHSSPLDNRYCTQFNLQAQVLLMNANDDALVTFDVHQSAIIYLLRREFDEATQLPFVSIAQCAEVRTTDLAPHPACVVGIQVTSLDHQHGGRFSNKYDSLLFNVSGRLQLLSPQSGEQGKEKKGDSQPHQLQAPLPVASFVEEMFHLRHCAAAAAKQPHLSRALWLVCGCKGTKVWMPLFPERQSPSDWATGRLDPTAAALWRNDESLNRSAFISKRIMLPFDLGLYPLVISPSECVALGVEREQTGRSAGGVQRRSEVFLQHVLRQLLKRNLGLYALQIAATCRHLAHFGHALELLLHAVLEEEATSSEPIPDPLLPRVIAFVQEFPEFLRTVAHCARKTELALWGHLFGYAGSPRELFEACIASDSLETAASFLIVLQNMEAHAYSETQALHLLHVCLQRGRFPIARDIVRFLRAIDPHDLHSPATTPHLKLQQQQHPKRSVPQVNQGDPNVDSFVYASYGLPPSHQKPMSQQQQYQQHNRHNSGRKQPPRQRVASVSAVSPCAASGSNLQHVSGRAASPPPAGMQYQSAALVGRRTLTKTPSAGDAHGLMHTPGSADSENAVLLKVHETLDAFAVTLLKEARIAELGAFSAHLDFHLVLWLCRERDRAARVQDPVAALRRLHSDFSWPYPINNHKVVEDLSAATATAAAAAAQNCAPASTAASSRRPRPLTIITAAKGNSVADSGYDGAGTIAAGTAERDNVPDEAATRRLLMLQSQRQCASTEGATTPESAPNGEETEAGTLASGVRRVTLAAVSSPVQASGETATVTSPTLSNNGEPVFGLHDYYAETTLDTLAHVDAAAVMDNGRASCQLRFMQQLMLEAACLEWSALLCVLLRDPVALGRAVNARSLATVGQNNADRLHRLAAELCLWADRECPGYKPMLDVLQRHLTAVAPVAAAPAADCTTPPQAVRRPLALPMARHRETDSALPESSQDASPPILAPSQKQHRRSSDGSAARVAAADEMRDRSSSATPPRQTSNMGTASSAATAGSDGGMQRTRRRSSPGAQQHLVSTVSPIGRDQNCSLM